MQSFDNALRPCIVLGLDTQIGLGIVRELGRAGVRVVGITHKPDALGLASRYLWRGVVGPAPGTPELAQLIRSLGEELGPCPLLAVSEPVLVWLLEHQHEFGVVRPVVAPAEALGIALDKERTLALARQVGIKVPVTARPQSWADIEALAASFPFPGVLKWSDPALVAPALRAHGLQFVKAEYVYTADELRAVARRYEPLGQWPLLQQYCPGQGLGQFFYMRGGQALRRFQHLRVAEWPPEGGFSSVCDALPLTEHVELQERSIELLRAMGWEGVAMVEYRLDPASGTARLMEVNGRFWGSFPLAVGAGAGFALLAYSQQGEGGVVALPPLRQRLRCRMFSTELKRLVRLLLQPSRVADRSFRVRPWAELRRFVLDYFRPNVGYYLWTRDDPAPFFADLRNVLRSALRR